ncbi:MAG TPA: NAD(P)/FAD-dependent oxidoreductase [Polyangiaceae bacterium]|nr:NAD(P)/FAD-dependent oxidoreductase [Polyangiaceae bacterium]
MSEFGQRASYDAVVVGSGPNGLSAAIVLLRAGLSTLLIEAKPTPGGGMRSTELTLPGFTHDVCSTVHPLGIASPFFRQLDLGRRGVEWCDPPLALAHVLRDGSAVTLSRSLTETARGLGADAQAYLDLMSPFVEGASELLVDTLGPLRLPRAPLLLARFGLSALGSLEGFAERSFREEATRALLAGMGAHAMQPLDAPATASFALVLAIAGHVAGWPVARGGSRAIADALLKIFHELGGELVLGRAVDRFEQLPSAKAYLFDLTPRQLLHIARHELPASYCQRLHRFRYGPGVFKMDWALSGPVPWLDPRCRLAATVHLSGTLADVAESEAAVHRGQVSQKPFVIFVQPSLFDPGRAPGGRHTGWAYCHVPLGSRVDAQSLIEAQIERFAPGFGGLILARSVMNPDAMERYNANYVGGDINGGSALLSQLFTRPVARLDPYTTPNPRLFVCSSSTPPGGGVHGMCGYWAANSALRRVFGSSATPLA